MRNLFLCVAMLFSFAAQAEECADFSGKWMFQGCEENIRPSFLKDNPSPLFIRQGGCTEISFYDDLYHFGHVKNVNSSGDNSYSLRHLDWSKDHQDMKEFQSVYGNFGETSYQSSQQITYNIEDKNVIRFYGTSKMNSYKNLDLSDSEDVHFDCSFKRMD